MILEERRPVADAEVDAFVHQLAARQRFSSALVAGLCAAVAGVTVWGTLLDWVGWNDQWAWQSWSCILVSAAVGLAMRFTGRGVETRFAVLGASLGASVPVLGELFATAYQELRVTGRFEMFSPADLGAFVLSRGGWDIVVFVVGGWAGARLACTRIDRDEVRVALSWRPEPERDQVAAEWVTLTRGL